MSEVRIQDFIARLRDSGIHLSLDGERLRYRATAGAMTANLRDEIVRRKPELLEALKRADAPRSRLADGFPRARRDQPIPLSFAQQRLFFIDQLGPGSTAYNMTVARQLDGPLDVDALRRAFEEIVRRHESLRTSFSQVDDLPVQVIDPEVRFDVPVVDLRELALEARDDAVARFVEEEADKPWNLSLAPLIRVRVFRCEDERHVLVVSQHHIVSDGWSMGVLFREMATIYRAFSQGEASPLAPLEVQYADFTCWQRDFLSGRRLEEQIRYWREALHGADTLLTLPISRPRPSVHSARGATMTRALPDALLDKLEKVGREEKATLFMVTIAALNVLLHRYTGRDDILVGTPIANRTIPEIEPLIGFFANMLILRSRCDGSPSFREFLRRVAETSVGAYAHQDLPFEMLVEELRPERGTGHNPLFQVGFAINYPSGDVEIAPGLTMRELRFPERTAKIDLLFSLLRGRHSSEVSLQYNSDLFEAEAIEKLLGHYVRMLECIAADPDVVIDAVSFLSVAERKQLLVDWNDTEAELPRDVCVHDWFEQRARSRPKAQALVCDGIRLSYGELDARSTTLARALVRRGVVSGSFVGVCLERSVDCVVALLSILKAGGVYLPIDPSQPGKRCEHILQDAKPAMLVTQVEQVSRFRRDGLRVETVDTLLEAGQNGAIQSELPRVSPDDLAYVIYTSGSTGQPKGVLIEHRGFCNLVAAQVRDFEMTPEDRVVQFAPMSFDASMSEMFITLVAGAELHIATREMQLSPGDLQEYLRREAATAVTLPPSILGLLDPSTLPRLRLVVSAGEALPWPLAEKWMSGVRLFNAYGPTETTVGPCWFEATVLDERGPYVPIGRPTSNVQLYVLDSRLELVPVGVPGELCVSGVGLARGYLNAPELTAKKFVPHPFLPGRRLYRTGDLVRWRRDGILEFLGRIDEQVKVRGLRIELGEIESALGEHPDVERAVVAVRDCGNDDKHLHAFVVARRGRPDADVLRAWLEDRVPSYMIPSYFSAIDAIPLNANGKVDRKALLESHAAEPVSARALVAPRTPTETKLAEVWRKVLRKKDLGIHDNFFDLGGHSLLAMQLVQEVRKVFNRPVPLVTLFAAPTIERLGRQLDTADQSETGAGHGVLRGTGSGAPLFHMPGLGGFGFLPPSVADRVGPDRRYFDGLQHRGLDGLEEPLDRVEAIADFLIPQIRAICPNGPYAFTGYCFGGLVAFEIARRLTAAGEDVTGVVMWDTVSIDSWEWRGLRGAIREMARQWKAADGGERFIIVKSWIRRCLRTLSGAHRREAFAHYRHLVETARKMIDAEYRASRKYRPGPYEGRVLLLRTRRDLNPRIRYERAPADGWSKIVHGSLEIVDFNCEHLEILEQPILGEAAGKMADFLRRGDEGAKSESGVSGNANATSTLVS